MEKLINNLLSGIENLITQYKNKNNNELHYRIGEFIVSFNIENKKLMFRTSI